MNRRTTGHTVLAQVFMLDPTLTFVVAPLKESTYEIPGSVVDVREAVRSQYKQKMGDIAEHCRVVVDIVNDRRNFN